MLSYEGFKFVVLASVLVLGACSRKPIQSSGTLPAPNYGITPEEVPSHEVLGTGSSLSFKNLKAWNEKAGKPTFGLIPAFYQLPQSMPAGAVYIEQGRAFGVSYESFWLSNAGPKPYAIEPASTEQAQIFSKTMNEMLDQGIHFVEVSMADANQILHTEKNVIKKKSAWFPGRQLPTGVELLVSIQKGEGPLGPAYVGRVIRGKDGRLLALATQVDAGPWSLESLLKQLVLDTLRRLADEK